MITFNRKMVTNFNNNDGKQYVKVSDSLIHKQPCIGVLTKRCSENMQQKCYFNKVAKQLMFSTKTNPLITDHYYISIN